MREDSVEAWDMKQTNPKDDVGSRKIPFHLWPETASILGSLAMLDGQLKYGRMNWRPCGARASVYYSAARRHLNAWWEGEDIDPDSGLPHMAHALACIAILIDTGAMGNLLDDRQFPGAYHKLLEEMTPHVDRLKEKHAGRKPRHYTIADAPRRDDQLPKAETQPTSPNP